MSEDLNTTQTENENSKDEFKEPITKKDPRRVEQGKRLAMISKQAKEKKMRERIEAEMAKELKEKRREEKKSWFSKFNPYTVGGVSLFLALYVYHFGIPFRESRNEEEEITMTKMKKVGLEETPKTLEIPKTPRKKFEGFD